MDRSLRTVADFLADPDFRQWVIQPDPAPDNFWQTPDATRWLRDHPDRQALADEARLLLLALAANEHAELTPAEEALTWAAIDARTTAEEGRQIQLDWGSGRSSIGQLGIWLRWGVAACLLLSLGWWYTQLRPIEYQTNPGETSQITLPDGSRVTLNGNTTLKIGRDWTNTNSREVWLAGEAFFAVTKQKVSDADGQLIARKFVVHSAGVDVEVVGTRFTVNTRQGQTAVVLNEGRVDLHTTGQQRLTLRPGEEARHITQNNQPRLTKTAVDTVAANAWRFGQLILRQTTLAELAQTLRETHGIRMEFADDALGSVRLTGTIPTTNLDLLCQIIAETSDLRVTHTDRTIRIRPLESSDPSKPL